MNDLEYVDTKDVAKMVREILKDEWPSWKFSVRTKRYAGGSSIDVYWTDGPTQGMVDSKVKHLQSVSHMDITDLVHYVPFNEHKGERFKSCAHYIFTSRDISFDHLEYAAQIYAHVFSLAKAPKINLTTHGHAIVDDNDHRCREGVYKIARALDTYFADTDMSKTDKQLEDEDIKIAKETLGIVEIGIIDDPIEDPRSPENDDIFFDRPGNEVDDDELEAAGEIMARLETGTHYDQPPDEPDIICDSCGLPKGADEWMRGGDICDDCMAALEAEIMELASEVDMTPALPFEAVLEEADNYALVQLIKKLEKIYYESQLALELANGTCDEFLIASMEKHVERTKGLIDYVIAKRKLMVI